MNNSTHSETATGSADSLVRATAAQQAAALAAGEVSSRELTRAHLDRIAAVDGAVGAFLDVDADKALADADAADAARREAAAAGEPLPELTGVPTAVKDLIVTRGQVTTAASRILEGWVPPYDATLVKNLRDAHLPILGKTNLDEFAMGGSTEHSAFGRTANPWDLGRIPGGSSGGSAAAVGAFEAPVAVGTDTGGSIRQPAAVTGTVGVKPTYGTVSRFGVIAMASSLDTPGPMARTVLDTALLHDVIASYDPLDSTSLPDAPRGMAGVVRAAQAGAELTGLRVGVIAELDGGEGYHADVVDSFHAALALLEDAGATVETVSLPHLEYALDAYYLIMPAEASSNLARYDGMRYGLRVEPAEGPVTAETVMSATRGAGFGDEVKRRIILGTHVLSAGYYDAYYGSAQKVRTLVQRDFAAAWQQADVLVSPTAPVTAYRFGEKDDPLAMYKLDVTTIPANLAGVPAMSLPSGLSDDGLPVGFQILAPQRADDRLYRVGAVLEQLLEKKWGGHLLAQAPELEVK
ncbi:Asp-tRNA(Asn)/Glu-tRNA(Gln) amidotransferase subunit GatA [Actinomyces ruminicola]|uniref:Glutamyl-tRNA(Gln) amidotransferase subunit A n=1 Tax=Actinomyces ruminicola TaxID=332524 RepID=A0A1G9XLU8_9ACTO|nr:Asp-tRNA(Asn)/Glu-tRNA(Gln) amidotransferase subunit GatA [Actinomyces ruminicola]SDM97812.1 aspartyl/glutamyl-tRNA(Asn/Gln) amidotransferase subunit A [Actinomyces ruminicola]